MRKLISIIFLTCIVSLAAFNIWDRNYAVTILDDGHPKPRGEMSRTAYMKQLCHVSTGDFLIAKIDKNEFEIDNFCNCFAINSVQLIPSSEDHSYALGYHTNNVLGQRAMAAGIDQKTENQLPYDSIEPLRRAYRKTYGVSKNRQLMFSKKSMEMTQTCITKLISGEN